jgi:hypothetical protein
MAWNDDLVALKRLRATDPPVYGTDHRHRGVLGWIAIFLAVYVVMPVIGVAVVTVLAYCADFLFSPQFHFTVRAVLTFLANLPR